MPKAPLSRQADVQHSLTTSSQTDELCTEMVSGCPHADINSDNSVSSYVADVRLAFCQKGDPSSEDKVASLCFTMHAVIMHGVHTSFCLDSQSLIIHVIERDSFVYIST